MSDSWYRDPPNLPPYEDGFGKVWTLDGQCLNPNPDPEPSWLDEWPDDLKYEALRAAVTMDLLDGYHRAMNANLKRYGL